MSRPGGGGFGCGVSLPVHRWICEFKAIHACDNVAVVAPSTVMKCKVMAVWNLWAHTKVAKEDCDAKCDCAMTLTRSPMCRLNCEK